MVSVGYDNSVRLWDLEGEMQVVSIFEDKSVKIEREG